MSDAKNWNRKVIEEFRANAGKVGGAFTGAPLLLLHTIGARSGQERINPMMYRDLGGPIAVFASKAGAPTHPDWYHNLLANPEVTAEIGSETRRFRARRRHRRRTRAHLDAAEAGLPGVRRLRGQDRPGDPRRHPRPGLSHNQRA